LARSIDSDLRVAGITFIVGRSEGNPSDGDVNCEQLGARGTVRALQIGRIVVRSDGAGINGPAEVHIEIPHDRCLGE
jgi:hypothetical protein